MKFNEVNGNSFFKLHLFHERMMTNEKTKIKEEMSGSFRSIRP
jgi:hypothetical protein